MTRANTPDEWGRLCGGCQELNVLSAVTCTACGRLLVTAKRARQEGAKLSRRHPIEKLTQPKPQSLREQLGIVFCETCDQDTMPLDTTGKCAFCDRQLIPAVRAPGNCRHGHKLTDDNVFVDLKGVRRCRECKRRANRVAMRKARAA